MSTSVEREGVIQAYRDVLGREPENARVVDEHVASGVSRSELVRSFADSPEGRARDLPVETLYAFAHTRIPVEVEGRTLEVWGDEDDGYASDAQDHLAGLDQFGAVLKSCAPDVRELIDIGANIGLAALTAAVRLPRAQITAVEPGARAFAALRRNLKANGVPNAEAVRLAIGARAGRGRVIEDPRNSSSAHVQPAPAASDTADSAVVETTRLDQLCADRGLSPDLLKIDVEGGEIDVLASAASTLARRRPYLYVEVNSFTCAAYGGRSSDALVRVLRDYGRSVVWFRNGAAQRLHTPSDVVAFWHHHFVASQGINDVFVVPDGRSLNMDRLCALLRREAG